MANRDNHKIQLPEIGGDPSDTCSELCEKSEGTILFSSGQSQAYVDKKWFSRLLELKKKKKENSRFIQHGN
ncbi:hypothetical protein HN51_061813 [Arachis hypogaea]